MRQPAIVWDDNGIPERFWHDSGEAAILAPRNGREWARLIRMGEHKTAQQLAERQRELGEYVDEDAQLLSPVPLPAPWTVGGGSGAGLSPPMTDSASPRSRSPQKTTLALLSA